MSTTTNLKLFKHDNPTTNTDQFDIEKAINENLDKLDENAEKVANKIQALEIATNEKDTSQDTEIESLKAENTILKSQIPSATIVGETVHLEDSSNMQCQISPIGASKQETREGYNLVDLSNSTLIDTPTTVSDLTATLNKDGTVLVNGTPSVEAINIWFLGSYNSTDVLFTLPAGTYKFKDIQVYSYDGTTRTPFGGDYRENDKSYTLEKDTPITAVRLARVELRTYANEVFYPMIYKDEGHAREWEQYGATPSIEFESPIESVGDNINRLPYPYKDATKTLVGVDFVDNGDGSVTVNGTATAQSNFYILGGYSEYVSFDIEEGSYRYSGCPEGGGSSSYILYCTKQSSDGSTRTYPDTGNGISIDISEGDTFRFFIRIISGATVNGLVFKPKLEKGTKATPYSPYGQGSVEIRQTNENLVPKPTKVSTSGGLTYTPQNDGSIKITGTATGYSDYWLIGSAMKFKPKSNFAIFLGNPINITTQVNGYDENRNLIANISSTNFLDISQYPNASYWEIGIKRKNNIETNTTVYPMVYYSESNDATEYIEHQSQTKSLYTQQPFRAIGDVKDRFVKVDGVWNEKHDIEKIVFDGSQNIYEGSPLEATDTNTVYVAFKYLNAMLLSSELNCLSENLQPYTGSYLFRNDIEGVAQSSSQIVFRISRERATTIDEVKTFLASNPITVYVKRAQPLLIPCTPEQVEVLESFNTYKNITNISSDSIGELEVTYSKDLETLYNNLSQAVLGGN